MTLLNRIGNKDRIALDIIQYFPKYDTYIEMFFGAGGIFFNLPNKPKYSFLNDLDAEVFNFYNVIKNFSDDFRKEFEDLILDENLFKFWKKEIPKDNIMRAIRFLFLSNYSLYGQNNTLKLGGMKKKYYHLSLIKPVNELLYDVIISNKDYKTLLKSIEIDNPKNVFVYADPPYLNTTNNYNTEKWTLEDTQDLFKIIVESGYKFAISEFDNPIILDLAKQYNLNIIEIGERRNLKNRQTEILIINYDIEEIQQSLFNI